MSSEPNAPDEDGFSLDGDGAFIGPGYGGGLNASCDSDGCSTVTGPGPGGWFPGEWWRPGGGDGGGSSSSSGSGGGGGGVDPEFVCNTQNLAFNLANQIKGLPRLNVEHGAIFYVRNFVGVVSGPLTIGDSNGVQIIIPPEANWINFRGSIHSHQQRLSTGNPAEDERYRIADQYPSPSDWVQFDRLVSQVVVNGGYPGVLSMFIVDQVGDVREYKWSDMPTYRLSEEILLQRIPGLALPPPPAPITHARFCGL